MPKGISKFRHPMADPILLQMVKERGLDHVPLSSPTRRNNPKEAWTDAAELWERLAAECSGPVEREPVKVSSRSGMTEQIKEKARELGASDVGVAELTPIMINEGREVNHRYIISLIVAERYQEILGGALAVELEAMDVYGRCAEISTALGKYIRKELGYPATADHNGSMTVQAIPAMLASGLGEMGKHGSLIHRKFGAGFRPSFVMTDLPIEPDTPDLFGVQDYCLNCRLCENNCPADAIAASEDYIVTEGYRRWLVDTEKCYTVSRLRDEYCHICVDVCPYVHKENGDREQLSLYKLFMGKRRRAGWKTPQWFIEDEEEVLEEAQKR